MSASDSMPAASVNAKSASASLEFLLQSLVGQRSGSDQRILKLAHQFGRGFAINPVQKFLFVQEKVAGQYSLPVKFLEKVAGGHRHLSKWFLRVL